MKNVIIGSTLLIFLFFSCDQNEIQIRTCKDCNFTCLGVNEPDVITNTCIDDWECQFNILTNSKVDLQGIGGVSAGNKIVFQMIMDTEGSILIADDEFTHTLVLELPLTQESFSAEGDQLADLQLHFRRTCFCVETEYKAITQGCIQGEKQVDGTWSIQGNLIAPYSFGNIDVKFEAQFSE